MVVEKGGKVYTVHECKGYWSVNTESGGLSVEIKVDKAICETEKDLRAYIDSNNEIF